MMRHEWNDDTLTVYLVGEMSSVNSEDIRKEIDGFLKERKCGKIVLDGSRLNYVSSAGLRVLLHLKKEVGEVFFVQASLEVYDILEMTGFTQLLNVRKRLVEVDVSSAQVIGEGRTGIVYRINKDTIIKVYKRAIGIEKIAQEMELSKASFVLGIPTAITFDIVKVGDKLGSRFEMLDCKTFDEIILEHPDKLECYLDEYEGLLKTIHSTTSSELKLPRKKEKWLAHMSDCLPYLSRKEGKALMRMVEDIPEEETFLHGDCHIKNIMSDGNALYLIDMGALSKGHPIFDLGALYRTFYGFDLAEPGNTEAFFNMPRKLLDQIYEGVMSRYFKGEFTEGKRLSLELLGTAYLLSWAVRYEGENSKIIPPAREKLSHLLDKTDKIDVSNWPK